MRFHTLASELATPDKCFAYFASSYLALVKHEICLQSYSTIKTTTFILYLPCKICYFSPMFVSGDVGGILLVTPGSSHRAGGILWLVRVFHICPSGLWFCGGSTVCVHGRPPASCHGEYMHHGFLCWCIGLSCLVVVEGMR